MTKRLYLFCLLPLGLIARQPAVITDAQADATVAIEMAAKDAQREARKIDFTVLHRRSYDSGDHAYTVERAAPPNLPEHDTNPALTPPTPAEQQAFRRLIQQSRQTEWIALRAVVYDNYGTPITHLRWQYEGITYEAWSEADFNYFRTLHDFSLDPQRYRLSLFIFNESVEALDKRRLAARAEGIELNLPKIPTLPSTKEAGTQYFVEAENPNVFKDVDAFIPIDHAHQFYDEHLEELKAKLANQNAINEARKRYLEQNPPSQDTTLTYWIEEK